MRIAVTGATGFVGRHLVQALLVRGHSVTALCRDPNRMPPRMAEVRTVRFDLEADVAPALRDLGPPELLVHLAWPGLPRYRDAIHLDVSLPASSRFLEAMVGQGVPRLLVVGTCFEYGMQGGALDAQRATAPVIAYAVAKDQLRCRLERLQDEQPFVLQWARLFYLHGSGQPSHCLLSQLDRAVACGDPEFPMSGGEQQRDYMSIEDAVTKLVCLVEDSALRGCFNVCSGEPTSIRALVERHIEKTGASIRPRLGAYPYASDEPMAFWGVPNV
jgi:dTDP-6-deoxy-L-talose 4-dehydrogenase (NAD+)